MQFCVYCCTDPRSGLTESITDGRCAWDTTERYTPSALWCVLSRAERFCISLLGQGLKRKTLCPKRSKWLFCSSGTDRTTVHGLMFLLDCRTKYDECSPTGNAANFQFFPVVFSVLLQHPVLPVTTTSSHSILEAWQTRGWWWLWGSGSLHGKIRYLGPLLMTLLHPRFLFCCWALSYVFPIAALFWHLWPFIHFLFSSLCLFLSFSW